jgi:hypothetical protein
MMFSDREREIFIAGYLTCLRRPAAYPMEFHIKTVDEAMAFNGLTPADAPVQADTPVIRPVEVIDPLEEEMISGCERCGKMECNCEVEAAYMRGFADGTDGRVKAVDDVRDAETGTDRGATRGSEAVNETKLTEREKVVLIAERCMGWTSCDRRAMGWGDGPEVWLTGDEDSPTYQGFNPCSSIADAFQAVEKMRGKGWSYIVTSPDPAQPSAEHFAQFYGMGFGEARASTAAAAISDAIVAALEGDRPSDAIDKRIEFYEKQMTIRGRQ